MRVSLGSTLEKIRLGVPEDDARFSSVERKGREKRPELSPTLSFINIYILCALTFKKHVSENLKQFFHYC